MMITVEQFSQIFPHAKDPQSWVDSLGKYLPIHDITDGPRLWMFLAQCGIESDYFTKFEEDLYYTANGLLRTFSKYFTIASANTCAKNPKRIANIVYANRLGNSGPASNDGYNYRGRGLIDITGKRNYMKLSIDIWGDDRAVTNPDLLLDQDGAIASACWYWSIANVNDSADREDIVEATHKVNGGENGLTARENLYNKIKDLLES